jgi:Tfp pilus assembly protein PilN
MLRIASVSYTVTMEQKTLFILYCTLFFFSISVCQVMLAWKIHKTEQHAMLLAKGLETLRKEVAIVASFLDDNITRLNETVENSLN